MKARHIDQKEILKIFQLNFLKLMNLPRKYHFSEYNKIKKTDDKKKKERTFPISEFKVVIKRLLAVKYIK